MEIFPNTKFLDNPSEDGRTDRQADMTKLIVAFHNFTKASNNNGTTQLSPVNFLFFLNSTGILIMSILFKLSDYLA
jgi:hypothetical protein